MYLRAYELCYIKVFNFPCFGNGIISNEVLFSFPILFIKNN